MMSRSARLPGRAVSWMLLVGVLTICGGSARESASGAERLLSSGAVVQAQETTAAQDEFVPIDELPPEDRLPAAPFLVAAYTVTLVLLVGYVWLLWRRLEAARRELHDARAVAARRQGGAGG